MADEVKFTLRFHRPENHELLGIVADHWGMSKNQLAEEILDRELHAAALFIESELLDTVQMLHGYRRDDRLKSDLAAFVEAEASERDPIQARLIEGGSPVSDTFGVREAFSS